MHTNLKKETQKERIHITTKVSVSHYLTSIFQKMVFMQANLYVKSFSNIFKHILAP